MSERTMEEIEALTKRFKDYIDKIQIALDKAENVEPIKPSLRASKKETGEILYTVISPPDVMADNIQSVLNVIDNAIHNIDEMDTPPGDQSSISKRQDKNKPLSKSRVVSSPNDKVFTPEELEFLQSTFSKIMNTSSEERSRIYKDLVHGAASVEK